MRAQRSNNARSSGMATPHSVSNKQLPTSHEDLLGQGDAFAKAIPRDHQSPRLESFGSDPLHAEK